MPSLHKEVERHKYHLCSTLKNKTPNYYPGVFNSYPGVSPNDLNLNDMVTLKAYTIKPGSEWQIDETYIDLSVSGIDGCIVRATTLTPLPPKFPLQRGLTVALQEEEILYSVPGKALIKQKENEEKNEHQH
jgi:hypothetical protein